LINLLTRIRLFFYCQKKNARAQKNERRERTFFTSNNKDTLIHLFITTITNPHLLIDL